MATNNATNTSTIITVSQGGTNATSFTAYAIITGGTTSTSALQNVASLGSSGQVLTSAGASALPTWTDGGTWVKLSSQTASNSASLTFTSLISATYSTYALLYSNVVPSSAAAVLQITVSTDNGSTYITTNYQSGINRCPYNSTTFTNTNSTSAGLLSGPISTTAGAVGLAYICNTTNGGALRISGQVADYDNAGAVLNTSNLNVYNTATNVNAFKLAMDSGNISTGTFTLYGIID